MNISTPGLSEISPLLKNLDPVYNDNNKPILSSPTKNDNLPSFKINFQKLDEFKDQIGQNKIQN